MKIMSAEAVATLSSPPGSPIAILAKVVLSAAFDLATERYSSLGSIPRTFAPCRAIRSQEMPVPQPRSITEAIRN